MGIFLIVIKSIIRLVLVLLMLFMLARLLISWYKPKRCKCCDLVYSVSEAVAYPLRAIFARIKVLGGLPIDISFVLTFVILFVITVIL